MGNNRAKYLFLMPGVCWILAFTLFPLIYSFGLSMTNYRLGRNPKYIGFENYAEILGIGDEKVDKKAVSTASFSAFPLSRQHGGHLDIRHLRGLGLQSQFALFATNASHRHHAAICRAYRPGLAGVVIFNEQSGRSIMCWKGWDWGASTGSFSRCRRVLPSCYGCLAVDALRLHYRAGRHAKRAR